MKIKKVAFPFSESYSFLGEKWWHRFFIVAYVITALATLGIAVALSIEGVEEKPYNINIKNNLRDFSKNSDKSVSNTVPLFLEQGGNIGCLEGNRINYVSTYSLREKTFCSADILTHIDQASRKVLTNGSLNSKSKRIITDEDFNKLNGGSGKVLSEEERNNLLSDVISKDSEKRYCFVSADIDCSSDKIISYNKNVVYYLQVITYSLISVYLVSLFLQVLYYKGFIYIVYGRNK